jgi:nucleoside-diphosphate-sugar epimerase
MRSSAVEIRERRAKKSGAVFISGANGFLGSHIAASLLGSGLKIIALCRGKECSTANERIAQTMAWHGIGKNAPIEVIDGDISKARFGLSQATYYNVAGRITEIIHCASSTSFATKNKAEVESVNVNGTKNILELARASSCTFFHLISTAYVGGKGRALCLERIEAANDYHNFYELSKCKAEELVMDTCADSGICVSIYRPSIIVGDSVNGKALLFNGMYYPVKVALYLRDLFREDIVRRDGRHAASMGVTMRGDGSLHMPVRLEKTCSEGGSINLVPIDYVIQAFRAIMDHDLEGGVYHIVNKHPITLETLINFTQEFLQISGVRACGPASFVAEKMTALERQANSLLKTYQPYISDVRRFETAHTDAILDPLGVTCPLVDYPLFTKCVSFAIENQWQNPTCISGQ